MKKGEFKKRGAVSFPQKKSKHKLPSGQEREILDLISSYSRAFTILERYDEDKLEITAGKKATFTLKYDDAKNVAEELKKELASVKEAGNLYGQEYPGKFESVIKGLYQTYDGQELYRTIEEKAAHLLYLIIKDHPFTNGNKRIAAFLFVYFLDKNSYLYKEIGEKKINDNALVALVLLIAISDPKDKDTMIKIITNLLFCF